MIRVENLLFSYGKEILLNKVSFVVNKGEKVALVGQNGSGKSTLFKLLSKKEMAEEGTIEIKGEIENVPQEVKSDEAMEKSKNIYEYIDPKRKKKEYEILEILRGLEMGGLDLYQSAKNLSGGQKTKLAIARALIKEADILLMDEPTNFLDKAGKEWVMRILANYPKTLILVSHDLEMLDKNIDRVLWINQQSKKIDEFKGNYSFFVKMKAEKEALLKRQIIAEEKHIVQMKKGLIKMARFSSEKGVRQRMNLKRRIEKAEINLPEMPQEAKRIKLILPDPIWVGSVPVWVRGVSKSFGENKVLDGVSLEILRGERVALMGKNGAGKSTLIKIIMGMLEADNGVVERDGKLKLGYYSQEFETIDFSKSLVEIVREKGSMSEGAARPILAKFLFDNDKIYQRAGSLSGGEKTRLSIAMLLVQNFNMLILDEPTTYLDPLSQRVILEAIKAYKGALLVVSHTPDFIKELEVNKKYYLPEKRLELLTMIR